MNQAQMDCLLGAIKICIDHKLDIPMWCYADIRGLQSDASAKMVAQALAGDEKATAKFNEKMIGIERRWNALMKRRGNNN